MFGEPVVSFSIHRNLRGFFSTFNYLFTFQSEEGKMNLLGSTIMFQKHQLKIMKLPACIISASKVLYLVELKHKGI